MFVDFYFTLISCFGIRANGIYWVQSYYSGSQARREQVVGYGVNVLVPPQASSVIQALVVPYAQALAAPLLAPITICLDQENYLYWRSQGLSIHDYVLKMKTIVDGLTAAGQVFSDNDLILYILGGLKPEYDSVVINLTSTVDRITLSEV
uniref:Uncharacterized protein n=1 Tax=Cannabis sativa TaxID=3483 RepID=A0A803Q3P6_CANSA